MFETYREDVVFLDQCLHKNSIVMLSVFLQVASYFMPVQPLCCPSFPKFPNSLMRLQIPSFFPMSFGRTKHTNNCVEVLYYLDVLLKY